MKTTLVRQDLYGKSYFDIVAGLNIDENHGDCCGWTESSSKDFLANMSDEIKNSARLVSIVEIDYADEGSSYDRCVCNFLFQTEDGAGFVLGYDLRAGSGSGWSYGAHVDLRYEGSFIARAYW